MKSIYLFLLFFSIGEYSYPNLKPYCEISHDGIDKRLRHIKKLLSNDVARSEIKSLNFDQVCIHRMDDTVLYAKIPYKDTTKHSFYIIELKKKNLRYVKVECDAYRFRDTFTLPLNTIWRFSSKERKISKTLLLDHNGYVINELSNKPYKRDSIYRIASFLPTSISGNGYVSYLNVSLIFDAISDLNYYAKMKKVIIQNYIPLKFSNVPVNEVECQNYPILKPVKLDSLFKKFNE